MYLFIKIRKHNCFYNENWADARSLFVLKTVYESNYNGRDIEYAFMADFAE